MAFWANVESLRKEQNTSYRWLAHMMGVSETTVSSMRRTNTEPRASQAVKIASALGTTVESLVDTAETPEGDDEYFRKYVALKEMLQKLVSSL